MLTSLTYVVDWDGIDEELDWCPKGWSREEYADELGLDVDVPMIVKVEKTPACLTKTAKRALKYDRTKVACTRDDVIAYMDAAGKWEIGHPLSLSKYELAVLDGVLPEGGVR